MDGIDVHINYGLKYFR